MAGGADMVMVMLMVLRQVPIICICNDRGSPKVRNLENYCLQLRFSRYSSCDGDDDCGGW